MDAAELHGAAGGLKEGIHFAVGELEAGQGQPDTGIIGHDIGQFAGRSETRLPLAVAIAEVYGEFEEVRIVPEGLRGLLKLLAGQIGLAGFHVETQQAGNDFRILRIGGKFALQGGNLAIGFAKARDPLAGLDHAAIVRVALHGAIPDRSHLIPSLLRAQDVAERDE